MYINATTYKPYAETEWGNNSRISPLKGTNFDLRSSLTLYSLNGNQPGLGGSSAGLTGLSLQPKGPSTNTPQTLTLRALPVAGTLQTLFKLRPWKAFKWPHRPAWQAASFDELSKITAKRAVEDPCFCRAWGFEVAIGFPEVSYRVIIGLCGGLKFRAKG